MNLSMKHKIAKTILWIVVIAVLIFIILGLNGCTKADRVNYNIRLDADNFKVTRRVIALNTRTDKVLFTVEGKISITNDKDGDLNVTIKTGPDSYQLFYAHLSQNVTYVSLQLDESNVNEYAYSIQFFPVKDVIENGLIDLDSTE